jgi:uncharacterized circularly permuted ATP-grasp superfamily protein/uncharacterized alpha-E superfamily protein
LRGDRQATLNVRSTDPGADRLRAWLGGYAPPPGVHDELLRSDGSSPDAWLRLLGALAEFSDGEFEKSFATAARYIRDAGVSHRIYGEDTERVWPLSPLPLLLSAGEWAEIATGVQQRAALLEAIFRDLYNEGRLVEEGRLPAAAVTGSVDFVRSMRGASCSGARPMHMYAVDLARGPDNRWCVLADRAQAPSGAGYALQNRIVLSRAFPALYTAMNVNRLAPFFIAFRAGLAAAAERSDPRICLLTPGPYSETYFEQARLARYLGFLLVEGEDLIVREDYAYIRTIAGLKRVDVIWRRVDADFIDPLELNGSSRLGAPGLLEAMRSGGVVISNAPGSGVLESRALFSFLPALCEYLLGEPLRLPNLATQWFGQAQNREILQRNMDSLALAAAFPGRGHRSLAQGPRLLADLPPDERDSLAAAIKARPVDFVGQEAAVLSTMPVWREGTLQPRPFVLRVYATPVADGWRAMPGGFCRVSEEREARAALSMGEGTLAADVWVLSEQPVEPISLLSEDVRVRRLTGDLPSRAADNLFWLGRYLERAEDTLRLVRSLSMSLMDSERALRGAGATHDNLRSILVEWEAIDESASLANVADIARAAMYDETANGSVSSLVATARRTASGMRERLSEDFWKLLHNLDAQTKGRGDEQLSEGESLARAEAALQALSTLSGLAQENMNRVAGWRFLDMGRRIERGVNTCRIVRGLATDEATVDDLDALLDLIDSQITYRSRYLEGIALVPVRDLAMLDPFNPRSMAFQVGMLEAHLSSLPALQNDGMPEEPMRLLIRLASQVETEDAALLDAHKASAFEQALETLSNAIADRFFLHGAKAAPIKKLGGLA